jgi:hypothetical protein
MTTITAPKKKRSAKTGQEKFSVDSFEKDFKQDFWSTNRNKL